MHLTRGPLISSFVKRAYSSRVVEAPLQPTLRLPYWEVEPFRQRAWTPARPVCLGVDPTALLPACHKWFIHDEDQAFDLSKQGLPKSSSLNQLFWKDHESLVVQLELTTNVPNNHGDSFFRRSEGPLKLLLDHLADRRVSNHSLYLAQCSLPSLPKELRDDLPTPEIVLKAGRGDIYDSSIWLGRPPTYTPLHRDPNPNLLMQLAGNKVIRLFPPDIGLAIFHRVQESIGQGRSSVFRGEEMMQGMEKKVLEQEVWDGALSDPERFALLQEGYEAWIGLGEALFIPKGWWHSVKGIGKGVTASVNWWFR